MSQGGKCPNAGRRSSVRNKRTIERALIAEQVTKRAEMAGRKLAKETLDDFMGEFAETARHYRMSLPGRPANPNADVAQYIREMGSLA